VCCSADRAGIGTDLKYPKFLYFDLAFHIPSDATWQSLMVSGQIMIAEKTETNSFDH
jgi:hypothetical protein